MSAYKKKNLKRHNLPLYLRKKTNAPDPFPSADALGVSHVQLSLVRPLLGARTTQPIGESQVFTPSPYFWQTAESWC